MKKSGSKAQKGFTLIEVSLAIVIGVIVLAGAITLYNQSKVAAGNSKAQSKSLALAGLVEEISAARNGAYPSLVDLNTVWNQRRDDARANPWGGAISGNAIAAPAAGYAWNTNATGAGKDGGTTGGVLESPVASAGQAVYITGFGPSTVYDLVSVRQATYSGYIVGIADNIGRTWSFVNGGK